MGEKANIPSDELAAAAAQGSFIRDQVSGVSEGVRDKVIGDSIDATLVRRDDKEQPDTDQDA